MPTMSVEPAMIPSPVEPSAGLRPAPASGEAESTFGTALERASSKVAAAGPANASTTAEPEVPGSNKVKAQGRKIVGGKGGSAVPQPILENPDQASAQKNSTDQDEAVLAIDETELLVGHPLPANHETEAAAEAEQTECGAHDCLVLIAAMTLPVTPANSPETPVDPVALENVSISTALEAETPLPGNPSEASAMLTGVQVTARPALQEHTTSTNLATGAVPAEPTTAAVATQTVAPPTAAPTADTSGLYSVEVVTPAEASPAETVASETTLNVSEEQPSTAGPPTTGKPRQRAAEQGHDATAPSAASQDLQAEPDIAAGSTAPPRDERQSNSRASRTRETSSDDAPATSQPSPAGATSTPMPMAPVTSAAVVEPPLQAAAPREAAAATNAPAADVANPQATAAAQGPDAPQPTSATPQPLSAPREQVSMAGIPVSAKGTSTKATTGHNTLSDVERARFVQRVARAMNSASDRGGELRLRLSPPELGSLKLEVSVREGVLNARLETETAIARQTLIESLPALRERLAEQNIKIDRFDVDVRDGSSGSLPDQQTDQSHAQRQSHASGRNRTQRAEDSQAIPRSINATTRLSTDGKLNVIV